MIKRFIQLLGCLFSVASLIGVLFTIGYLAGFRIGLEKGREESLLEIMELENHINRLQYEFDNTNSYIIQYFHGLIGEDDEQNRKG